MDDSYIPTGGVSAWQEEVPSGHTPVPNQLLPDQSSPTLISDWLAVFLSFSFLKLFFVFLLVVLRQEIFYFQRVRRGVKDAQ